MVMNGRTVDGGLETWLRTEVVAVFDELRADPSQAIRAEDVRASITSVHALWTTEHP